MFKPYVFDGIDNAKGSYESIYGKITASWKKDVANGIFEYNIELPPNTYGKVIIPAVNAFKNTSIKCFDEKGNAISEIEKIGADAGFNVQKGKYKIVAEI